MALPEVRPWIAAFTVARARASSNSSSSRDVARARCVANAVTAVAAGLRARAAAALRSAGRAALPFVGGAAFFAARFGAAARFALCFAVCFAPFWALVRRSLTGRLAAPRRLALARVLPARVLAARRLALFRLVCFFPAARATRFPVRSAGPAEAGSVSCSPGARPGLCPARDGRARSHDFELRRYGTRHRRIVIHAAAAL